MRYLLPLFVLLISCGVPQSTYEQVQAEKDSLQNALELANKQVQELEYLSNTSEVVLATPK